MSDGQIRQSERRQEILPALRLVQDLDSAAPGLTLEGELDLIASDVIQQRLRELGNANARVVVDLSGITFIDCSGLRALVQALQTIEAGNSRLQLNPECSAPLRRLVELIHSAGLADRLPGLDRFFPLNRMTNRTTP
ncbi:MAG TPA: STAS domain-containing protein [Nitrolancea sp.]|jgi:anti-anti-sigma factor|nr:STAS domain-containing protein [Nitrolancea sp.]